MSRYSDFDRSLPNFRMRVALDVGANIGQTSASILRRYRGVNLHSFEPVRSSFDVLQRRFKKVAAIKCHNIALGDVAGQARVTAIKVKTGNRILSEGEKVRDPVEVIEIERGDAFCRDNTLDSVSFLKIDTEGFDLAVLRGFSSMLSEQRVDLVQIEASMNSTNTKHVAFSKISDYLEPMGYHLFKIYEQTHEIDGRPYLRRADAVFISQACADQNRQPRRGKEWRRIRKKFRHWWAGVPAF